MPIFTLAIGIAITAWVGIMGAAAMLRTEAASKWFGEMLKQSPALMMVNGLGLFVAAALVGTNLFDANSRDGVYCEMGFGRDRGVAGFHLVHADAWWCAPCCNGRASRAVRTCCHLLVYSHLR